MRQRYDEEILHVDDALRSLVKAHKARNRWDRTILAITSDHGEEFWDHGGFEHGHTLMGELTRVPLILSGAVPKIGRVDAVVEHVDLVEGLVQQSGAQSIPNTHGSDLWAVAEGRAEDHDNIALSENILYGPPKVSAVDATARLDIDNYSGVAELRPWLGRYVEVFFTTYGIAVKTGRKPEVFSEVPSVNDSPCVITRHRELFCKGHNLRGQATAGTIRSMLMHIESCQERRRRRKCPRCC